MSINDTAVFDRAKSGVSPASLSGRIFIWNTACFGTQADFKAMEIQNEGTSTIQNVPKVN